MELSEPCLPRGRRRTGARLGATAAAGLLLLAVAVPRALAAHAADPAPVPWHPAIGDTLDAREAARFGLLADEPGLRWAVVVPAPWGGYIVRLGLTTPSGDVTRERNLPTAHLHAWRARIDALERGEAAPPDSTAGARFDSGAAAVAAAAAGDSLAARLETTLAVGPDSTRVAAPDTTPHRVPVWPEVPLPASRPRPPGMDAVPPGPPAPVAPARWLVSTGVGYRHCASDFNRFFTDMGQLEVAVTRRLGRTFVPYAAFIYGFGDIQDAFEAVSENGRSALYGLEAGVLARVPVSRRAHLYGGLGGGYYMRSLRWGGDQFIGTDGYLYGGTLVREFQDWGGSARLGLQFALPATGKGKKERLLDIQLRLEEYARSSFEPFGADSEFSASGRDRWIAFSVSLLTGL